MYRRAATIAGQLASRHVVSFLEPGLLSRVTMYAGPTYSASVCSTRPHATLQSGLRAFCTFDVQNEVSGLSAMSVLQRPWLYVFVRILQTVLPARPNPVHGFGRSPCVLALFDGYISVQMNAVNELFAEAREEIEFAKEEAETVYFNESVQTARRAVEACMSRWEGLLAALPEAERNRVMRSMGLKIAQLQAEYDEVSKLHLED
ncbi:hypothetical protein Vretimale_4880 [Volvox reticuliferus]|uniref:Uncharacterized protein n=1 Tax=Volvox reticuliferus TaxID=1737510 RepID=A0A8J4FFU9_9CHLO|nr:hypothetical protein Vretifemale_3505 [Volvox reticuliferus]GIL99745.1 hypothetical protein Vretimale_4880 [Volvox reticuliferus]